MTARTGKISVALAAFEGERYLAAQLDSVLSQLGPGDELILSDDRPGGETGRLAAFYAASDARVRVLAGPDRGLVANFEHALRACTGDLIFLCDQDDIWLPGKVEAVRAAFAPGVRLVLHNAEITDQQLRPTGQRTFDGRRPGGGALRNIFRNSFQGCCMAFDAALLPRVLPFPPRIPMHDQWIGIWAALAGRVAVIEEPLLLYRRHSGAVTGRENGLWQKLLWRARLCAALFARLLRR